MGVFGSVWLVAWAMACSNWLAGFAGANSARADWGAVGVGVAIVGVGSMTIGGGVDSAVNRPMNLFCGIAWARLRR